MSTKPARDVWTAADHPWSLWVKRPLLASLEAEVAVVDEAGVYRAAAAPWAAKATGWLAAEQGALILDLPGPAAVELALALGPHGFRPILSINASSAAREVIDMQPVLRLLAEGARHRACFPSGPSVRPAFILDSRRDGAGQLPKTGSFDNRWLIFPSDLPSARQLEASGVRTVTVVQEGASVREDVLAITRGYQRQGLPVQLADVRAQTTTALPREPSGWLSSVVGALRRRYALRRRWDGSYGHRVPIPPDPSHG